jgi:hypothetical protein
METCSVSADLSALWTPTVGHDERVTEDPGAPGTPSNPYRGSGGAVRAWLDPGIGTLAYYEPLAIVAGSTISLT